MPQEELRAALAAVSFLSRIPVGPLAATFDGEDVRRAGAYFPLVGAGIGALSGAVSARAGAPVGLAVETVITGALHLDALADAADSLGTADRERSLEIMRDSRIGAFGTAAVCLDLMVKASALERCEAPVRVAVCAGALSRAVPVLLSAVLPYARPGAGTGQAITTIGRGRAVAAAALAATLSRRDPGAIAVAGVVTVASAAFWRRRLGGVTGDTLGASIELCEAAILVWSAGR